MSAPKFEVLVEGVDSLARALKLADPECHARVAAAIKTSEVAVLAGAEGAVPRRSGELASTGRTEERNEGLIGLVEFGFGTLERRGRVRTARRATRRSAGQRKLDLALASTSRQALSSVDPGVYAPVVDRGDPKRNIVATHYLTGPFEAQRPAAIAAINAALNGTVASIAEAAV
jgi:hypothetical protein